jgi:anti-sigma factor RsiW
MDCKRFEAQLEALVEGRLSAAEADAGRQHWAGCAQCRELAELAGLIAPGAEPTASDLSAPDLTPPDLTGAILARTSGSACASCESRLADFVDGALAAADGELVALHLAACAACSPLAAELRRLAGDLPRLASVAPGPGFVEAVLAASLPWPVQLRRWWRASWPRWVRRPRFSLEVAYATTLILALLVSLPGSPLAALPERALDRLATDPTPWVAQVGSALGERAERQEKALGQSRLAGRLAGWLDDGRDVTQALPRRGLRWGRTQGEAAWTEVRTFWQRTASFLTDLGNAPHAEPDRDSESTATENNNGASSPAREETP